MADLAKDKNILVLSADKAVSILSLKTLKGMGYQNLRASSNGLEAMESIAENPCDFIICDMNIKFISGWSLIKEIKVANDIPNLPCILLGKEAAPASEDQLKNYGVVQYLGVPFTESDMSFLINSTLFLFKTSGTIESKFTDAKDALINKKTEEAIDRFEELNGMCNQSSRSAIGLAQSYLQNDDRESAERTLSNINEDDSLNPSTVLLKAKVLLTGKKTDEATIICRNLLQEDLPNKTFYYSKLLDIFMKFKSYEFARELCTQGMSSSEEIPDFISNLAKIDFFEGHISEALNNIAQMEDSFGVSNDSLNLKGICLKKTGQFKEAITTYEQALEISPMDYKLFFNMSSCAIAMKDYEMAKRYLKNCLDIAPQFSKAQEKLTEIEVYFDKVQKSVS